MKIRRLRILLPLMMICLMLVGAESVFADTITKNFLKGTSTVEVVSGQQYEVIDGIYEAEILLNNTEAGITNMKAHVLLIEPDAKASFVPVIPGYFTEGSTAESRKTAAANWGDSNYSLGGVTDMVAQYESAADSQTVLAAFNGDFSNSHAGGAGNAPNGPVIIEGNLLEHSKHSDGTFLFGRKSASGVMNIVQSYPEGFTQIDEFDSAICGPGYILRNGKVGWYTEESGTNKYRQRTGIGYRTNGEILVITVESGLKVQQFGELMQASGCWNGVNMDGGGSINFQTKRSTENHVSRKTPSVEGTGYTQDDNHDRLISNALLLVADDEVVNNVGTVSGSSIETDADEYLVGQPINVTASSDEDGAWVSLLRADDDVNATSYWWYYIYGANGDAGTWCWDQGATYNIFTDGSCSNRNGISSPYALPAGEYRVAILDYAEDGTYKELASKPITIEEDPNADAVEYTLSTDKTLYDVGDPILITATAPRSAGAWVGIVKHGRTIADAYGKASYYWNYVPADFSQFNIMLAANEVGSVDYGEFPSDEQALIDRSKHQLLPGSYDVVLFQDGGYTYKVTKTIQIVDTEAIYNIIYKDGSGILTNLTPSTYTYKDVQSGDVLLPATVNKEGHNFLGWYDNASFSGSPVTNIPQGSSGDKTFYAKFETLSYDVIFDTDGGTEISTQNVLYGECAARPLTDPEKTDMKFMGWVTEKDGIEAFQFDKPITGPTIVYAKWQMPTKYTVSFDTVGGSIVTPQGVDEGEKAVKPNDPTREGYTFDKWVTEENGTVEFDFDTVITDNTTIYATWNVVEYTITYDTNGGDVIDAVKYTIESEDITLPELTREGYSFLGWKDAEGNTYTKIASGSIGDLTLIAQWKRETYLAVDKTTYVEGQAINVTAYSEIKGSWVGLYKDNDVPGTTDLSFYYDYLINPEGENLHNGIAFNLLNYKNPDSTRSITPGNYKVILFDADYGVLKSVDITITESTNPVKGTLTITGYTRDDKVYGVDVNGLVTSNIGNPLYEYMYGDSISVSAEVTGDGAEGAWIGVISDEAYSKGLTGNWVGDNWFNVADFEGQSVNLNDVVKSRIVENAPDIPFGLSYWVVLVSGSGKILDGEPFIYRTFNMDWIDTIWGDAVKDEIVVETDWVSKAADGEDHKPSVTIKHINGHFGYERDKVGNLVEITEKNLVEGQDYTLVYPSESKEPGSYTIEVQFPGKDGAGYNYLSTKPEQYGLQNGILYYLTETEHDFIISYILNGGKNHQDNPGIYQTGTAITLKAPSRLGYIFDGWYTTDDFQKGTQISSISEDAASHFTVYAKWTNEANAKYQIKYVLNGGDNDILNPSGYTGEADITLKPAKKTGYTFDGWFYDSSFTRRAEKIVTGMQGNITLYAKFTKNAVERYTITTTVKGGSITGSKKVNEGGSCMIEYAPNNGYELKSVTVDGKAVSISKYASSYTFTNITANHEILVTYTKIPEVPAKVTMKSIVTGNKKISVEWKTVSGADKYQVYRSTDNKTFKLVKTTTSLSYTDSDITAGKTYYYKVSASKNGITGPTSSVKSIKASKTLAKPSISSIVGKNGKVTVKWDKVANATGYKIYCSADNGKTYTVVATTTKTFYTTTKTVTAQKYKYSVQAVQNGFEGKKSSAKTVTVLAKTKGIKVVTKNTNVTVSWTKVTNASKYQVYRSTDGGKIFKKVLTTEKTSAKFKNLKAGKKLQYKVRAIKGSSYGKFSVIKKITVIGKTNWSSVTTKKAKVTLKWKKVTGAASYQIYRSVDGGKTYKKVATVKGKTTLTTKKLTVGKTYKYKVRAINGSSYGKFSTVKSVKVK